MHLLVACQTVASPLGDEWAEAKGDSLKDRLKEVRTVVSHLESSAQQVGFSLQLLINMILQDSIQEQNKKYEQRVGDGPYQLEDIYHAKKI